MMNVQANALGLKDSVWPTSDGLPFAEEFKKRFGG